MAAKYNPFRPNNMVGPGMFVGRIDELRTIARCLFQAKNGNPQHFLAQGERGIGKSSLLFYVELLARGQVSAKCYDLFRFLVVSVDLAAATTQLDIIRTMGRGLRQSLAGHHIAKAKATEFWDWITNWEILGVKYHKPEEDADPAVVADDLVERLTGFSDSTKDVLDGIVLLIDEADRPSVDAGLGEFLKLLTERLARRQCLTIVIGLAGLPTILGKLRDSHESSPRLFETLLLEPLEFEERKQVVTIGLAEANAKNDTITEISDDALELLAELSEGYPHFVQQFAFSAFAQDTDNLIDDEDVYEGAFKDGGALSQLGDKFFNEMYHARISSEDYRRVLDAMAEHGDEWVARKNIIKESGVSEANVDNALGTLKVKEVILQDETRRGFYRLPTNSFAAWINANKAARAKSDAVQGGAAG